ncbi:MAG TPA: deoxyribonuclease V [Gemmataceae bacterium]|nr:deoxyribonuclease V [Gemmataceae bacterium]
MKIHPLHSWDLTIAQATELQRELAAKVDVRPALKRCELIAGADISYNKFSPAMYAAVVVLRMSDLSIVEVRGAVRETTFPYQPGYLSFREAPALIEAFARVESEPDAIMFDGQGIAHPRRLGLASHVGLWLQKPSIGCAKSRLVGRSGDLPRERGSAVPLVYHGEEVGMVVRTKDGVQPVYVSPGHRIDTASAVELVLRSCAGYRIPEPTRQAHLHVNALRRGEAEPL